MSFLLIPIYDKNMEYVNAIIEDSDHEGHKEGSHSKL